MVLEELLVRKRRKLNHKQTVHWWLTTHYLNDMAVRSASLRTNSLVKHESGSSFVVSVVCLFPWGVVSVRAL